MRGLLVLAVAVSAVLFLASCGDSETKTVTETVTATEEAAPPAGAAAPEEEAEDSTAPTATTIPDGTWVKGEYTPGTYRAPGGQTCEWEKRQNLNEEAEGTGNWGISETNIIAEIDSPYFKTEGCGVWRNVG